MSRVPPHTASSSAAAVDKRALQCVICQVFEWNRPCDHRCGGFSRCVHYRRDTQIARGDPVTRGVGVLLSGILCPYMFITGVTHPRGRAEPRVTALAARLWQRLECLSSLHTPLTVACMPVRLALRGFIGFFRLLFLLRS